MDHGFTREFSTHTRALGSLSADIYVLCNSYDVSKILVAAGAKGTFFLSESSLFSPARAQLMDIFLRSPLHLDGNNCMCIISFNSMVISSALRETAHELFLNFICLLSMRSPIPALDRKTG